MTTQSPPTVSPTTGRHPIRKIEVFGVVDLDGKLFESHYIVGCDGRAEDEKDYGGIFVDRQAAHLLAGECGSDDNPLDVQPMTITFGQDTRAEIPTVETECFVLVGLDGKPAIWPEGHSAGNFEGDIRSFRILPDMRNAAFTLTRYSDDADIDIRKARLIVEGGSPTLETPKLVPEPIDVWVGFNDGKVMTANHDEDDSSKCLLADVYTDHRHGMMEIMGTGSTEGAAEMVAATLVFKESPRYKPEAGQENNAYPSPVEMEIGTASPDVEPKSMADVPVLSHEQASKITKALVENGGAS